MGAVPFFGPVGILHILNVLGSRERSAFEEIISDPHLDISTATLMFALTKLVEQGFAKETVHGGRNFYSLTEKGMRLGPLNQIEDLADGLNQLIENEQVRKRVLEGIEQINVTSTESETAAWYKGAMARLDALVDKTTRNLIMQNCGYHGCASANRGYIEEAVARRKKHRSIEEFLKAEISEGRITREEETLYQTYTPRKNGMRCYCSLVRSLPENETISPTYCQCAAGLVKKYWEEVLEKPVKVELVHTSISGAQECKFAVHP